MKLRQGLTKRSVSEEAVLPGEESATVTTILSGATDLGMSLPIRVNSVFLGALFAFQLLLAVLSAVVFL